MPHSRKGNGAAGKKDAYTRLFHEWLDPLMGVDLSGAQLKVILFVARNSFGWGKKGMTPNWTQAAKIMNLSRPTVSVAATGLVGLGILERKGEEIFLNKDSWSWKGAKAPTIAPDGPKVAKVQEVKKTARPSKPVQDARAIKALAQFGRFPNAALLVATWKTAHPGMDLANELSSIHSYAVSHGIKKSASEWPKYLHHLLRNAKKQPAGKPAGKPGQAVTKKMNWGIWETAAKKAGLTT